MALALFLAPFVGLALGLFGGGGSILSVAVLAFALGMPANAAIAASLLVIGVASTAALCVQRASGLISVRTGLVFGAAGMLGAFAGGRMGSAIPEAVLLTAFGAVMLLTSIVILSVKPTSSDAAWRHASEEKPVHYVRLVTLALGIGVVTGILGAGGGFLIVPVLVSQIRMPMKRALATSLLVVALQSFAGFTGHLGQANLDWTVVLPFTLIATLGSVVGGALAMRAPTELLRRGFAGLALLVALVVALRGAFMAPPFRGQKVPDLDVDRRALGVREGRVGRQVRAANP